MQSGNGQGNTQLHKHFGKRLNPDRLVWRFRVVGRFAFQEREREREIKRGGRRGGEREREGGRERERKRERERVWV